MPPDDLLLQLIILAVLHLIGGIALGWGVRQVAAQRWGSKIVAALVLGIGFGVLPLALGASTFLAGPARYLFFVELLIFLAAASIPAFAPAEYLAVFTSPSLTLTILSGFAILTGTATILVNARRDWGGGFIAGGLLILIGVSLGGLALTQTFRKH